MRKGTALTTMAMQRTGQLMVVRLDNHLPIATIFGPDAAHGAMKHLGLLAERHYGCAALRRVEGDEVELSTQYPPTRCGLAGVAAETLCASLVEEPFRWEGEDILLSISAGWAVADLAAARVRLAASSLAECARAGGRNGGWVQYRKDMAAAAKLLRQVRKGAAFVTWRPVSRPDDPRVILYHEAVHRCLGHRGEQADCAEGYAALARLGMAHVMDRRLLADVLDELESDPAACLGVSVSSQSLSLNLQGEGIGWIGTMERLEQDRDLAGRLVIEINDHGGMLHLPHAIAFVRKLRGLGTRFVIGRFGAGQATIEQMMALSPDAVKLDGAFLNTTYRSGRNRERVRRLIELARTISPIVILDGIESPWHLHLAKEEGAEWVVGTQLGRASLRREWLDAGYAESVASLAAFKGAFHSNSGRGYRLGR